MRHSKTLVAFLFLCANICVECQGLGKPGVFKRIFGRSPRETSRSPVIGEPTNPVRRAGFLRSDGEVTPLRRSPTTDTVQHVKTIEDIHDTDRGSASATRALPSTEFEPPRKYFAGMAQPGPNSPANAAFGVPSKPVKLVAFDTTFAFLNPFYEEGLGRRSDVHRLELAFRPSAADPSRRLTGKLFVDRELDSSNPPTSRPEMGRRLSKSGGPFSKPDFGLDAGESAEPIHAELFQLDAPSAAPVKRMSASRFDPPRSDAGFVPSQFLEFPRTSFIDDVDEPIYATVTPKPADTTPFEILSTQTAPSPSAAASSYAAVDVSSKRPSPTASLSETDSSMSSLPSLPSMSSFPSFSSSSSSSSTAPRIVGAIMKTSPLMQELEKAQEDLRRSIYSLEKDFPSTSSEEESLVTPSPRSTSFLMRKPTPRPAPTPKQRTSRLRPSERPGPFEYPSKLPRLGNGKRPRVLQRAGVAQIWGNE